MGLVETYVNLKDYDSFEIAAYELQRNEARECLKALEKQIPEKARIISSLEKVVSGYCPCCNNRETYFSFGDKPTNKSYCRKCGQLIDWS